MGVEGLVAGEEESSVEVRGKSPMSKLARRLSAPWSHCCKKSIHLSHWLTPDFLIILIDHRHFHLYSLFSTRSSMTSLLIAVTHASVCDVLQSSIS